MSEFADLYLRAREGAFSDPENRRAAPQTRPAPRVRAPLLRPPTPVDMGQRYPSFDDAAARGALRAANERGVATLQAGIVRDPYATAARAEAPISAPETAGVVAHAAPGFAAELTGLPSAYRMGQDIGQAAQAFRYGDRLNAADEMVSAGANFLGTAPGGLAAERAITGGIGALGRAARPVIRDAQEMADLPPLAPVRGAQDWQVDRPLFHGTNTPIEGDFRPTRRPTLPEPQGVSFAERPEMAAQFGSSIYPTYARGEIGSAEDFMQRARAKMAQGMSMEAAADAVQQEFVGAGYTGVRFQTGENVIFDPANTISALDPSVASARSGPIARRPAPRTTMQHVTALSRGDWQPTPQEYEAAARTLPPNMAAPALIGAATGAALAPQDAEAGEQPYGNWVIDVSDYPADKDGNRPQSSPRPRVGEFDGNPIPLGPNDPDMYVQPLRDGGFYAFRVDQYGRANPIGRARYVNHSGLTEGPPSGLESGSNSLQALGGLAAGALTRGMLKRAPRLVRGIAPVVAGAGAGGVIAVTQGDDAAQGLAFGAGGGGAASLAGIANRARRLAPAPRLSGREIVRVGERSAASVPIDVSAFRPPLNDQYAPIARNPFSGTAGAPSDAAARARGVGDSEDLMLRRARGAVLQQEMGDRLRGRQALAPREAPPLLSPPQTRQARAPQPPPGMEEAMRRAANARLGRVDARGVANHRAMAAALNDAGLASIDTAKKAPQLRADLARVLSQGSQEQRAEMARAIAAATGISLSAALMMVQGAADEHDNSPWQQEQARQ